MANTPHMTDSARTNPADPSDGATTTMPSWSRPSSSPVSLISGEHAPRPRSLCRRAPTSGLSTRRYPLESPDHPSLPNFVEYLRSYASAFSLWPHIHLRLKVVSLSKVPPERVVDGYSHHAVLRRVLDDGSLAEGQDDIHLTCQRVVITTGLHVLPNIPVIPGLNDGTETLKSPAWIHSSEYKSRDQLRDKEVLVLGAGETGMDVAYESVLAPARKVWMGVRSGFLSFPKVLNNFRVLGSTFEGALPIDGLITNLFETAYVHPWVSASHLRWFVSDFVIRRVLWVLTGTQAGCNQWAGELPPERQGRAYVFLNKSAKAMQFINRPYTSLSPLHRLFAHYQDPPLPEEVDDPTIHVVPFPSRFDHTGKAIFPPPPAHRSKEKAWKETCRPDLVVLCTGYRQEFGWLGEGYPRGPDECNVRGVCSDKDLSVAFIGFLRPGVGEYCSTLFHPVWMILPRSRVWCRGAQPPLILDLTTMLTCGRRRVPPIPFGRRTYQYHAPRTTHPAPRTTHHADTLQAPSPQWPKCRSSSSSSSRPSRSPSQTRRRTITSSTPRALAYSTAWTTRPTRPRSRGTWARRLG